MKFHEAALFAYALAPELVTAPAPALTGPGAAEAGDDAQVAH